MERWEIAKIIARHSVDREIMEALNGRGPQWHAMAVGDPDPERPELVFCGHTPLPEGDVTLLWNGVQHWCLVLTEIRRLLDTANWRVAVDDHVIAWDEETRSFDPSQ